MRIIFGVFVCVALTVLVSTGVESRPGKKGNKGKQVATQDDAKKTRDEWNAMKLKEAKNDFQEKLSKAFDQYTKRKERLKESELKEFLKDNGFVKTIKDNTGNFVKGDVGGQIISPNQSGKEEVARAEIVVQVKKLDDNGREVIINEHVLIPLPLPNPQQKKGGYSTGSIGGSIDDLHSENNSATRNKKYD